MVVEDRQWNPNINWVLGLGLRSHPKPKPKTQNPKYLGLNPYSKPKTQFYLGFIFLLLMKLDNKTLNIVSLIINSTIMKKF